MIAPISPGWLTRGIGVSQVSARARQLSVTSAVISVAISPGCTSQSAIPPAPSRTARVFDTISAALWARYPTRCTATATASGEVTLMMARNPGQRGRDRRSRANPCDRKNMALVLTIRQQSQLASVTSDRSPRDSATKLRCRRPGAPDTAPAAPERQPAAIGTSTAQSGRCVQAISAPYQ